MRVVLEIDNTRVRVREAPESVLRRLHESLAYLSPTARAAGMEGPAEFPSHDLADETQWDGMIRLFRRPAPRVDGSRAAPWFETGLLPRAMAAMGPLGTEVQMLDFRRRPEPNHDVPRAWSQAPSLFDYQESAVDASTAAGSGVVVAPPRAGKTRIMLETIRRLNQPSLIVAPTTSIVDQTARVALEYGFDQNDVLVLDSKVDWARAAGAWIWICTAAKSRSIPVEAARTREVVACDELHHYTKAGSWGRELHKLFPHVFHWFGYSGTYFRSAGDDMSLEAFLGNVVSRISSADLLQRGRLVPTRVAFVPVQGPRIRRGLDPRRDGLFLHEHRNGLVAASALHLVQRGHRVLVMVGLKEQGRRVADLLNHHGPGGKRGSWKFAEFLFAGRGGVAGADRRFRRGLTSAFLDGTGPAVLIGTSLIGEGVDLPDASALIWARGQSAAVSYLQGIYRVCTASEGKKEALVVDFMDSHDWKLKEASEERRKIAESDPVFQVTTLADAQELGPWVAR